MPNRPLTKNIVILGIPPVDLLNIAGPTEAFRIANTLADKYYPYQVELVSPGPDKEIKSESGISVLGQSVLADKKWRTPNIDTLIVTTNIASFGLYPAMAIEWMRTQASRVRRICTVSSGIFALAQTGMLEGKRVATHWRVMEEFSKLHPGVHVEERPIWVKDGKIYSSAGMSAGIDLALNLIADDHGEALAGEVTKELVLFLRRPADQAQLSYSLLAQYSGQRSIKALQPWIHEHLSQELSVDVLADRLAMSRSTLIRIFKHELNTTPAKYIENIRMEAAQRFLQMTSMNLDKIAMKCGFTSADVFRRVFQRNLGISPLAYREQHSKQE
ncbi:AraC family transcriptional regulator with amidase-like domain [Sodalis ligni]|uniref:AraC family transcriptional regulator with amidase-like domain n=2 Tax=Bruguierivoracaceae TaxID=2812006 RepID=A0A4R1NFK1_9GAMM|nr:AraC family transcriptional regulator with amidase-like domain [Sodalis ligni]